MITAIVDTNVLVRAAISSRGASFRVLQLSREHKFQFVFSNDTIDELLHVLLIPSIRARHGQTDAETADFVRSLMVDAAVFAAPQPQTHEVRDATDSRFLSLAAVSQADYLVTKDRRHLLRLGKHGKTHIVTPTEFLRIMA